MNHEALLQSLPPLPIRGAAWPTRITAIAWIILVVIGVRLIYTAASPAGQTVGPVIAASIVIPFIALVVVARYMQISETRITHEGIEQTWLTRRFVRWEDIQFAKFIPLIASKRLVCFTGRGRPIVFQAGTQELQVAFAHIALAYRRKP